MSNDLIFSILPRNTKVPIESDNRVKKVKMINNRSKLNQFAFHLSNPILIFFRNISLKLLTKNKKFLENYLGKIYKN